MNRICLHPVLSQSLVFKHFLTCGDNEKVIAKITCRPVNISVCGNPLLIKASRLYSNQVPSLAHKILHSSFFVLHSLMDYFHFLGMEAREKKSGM